MDIEHIKSVLDRYKGILEDRGNKPVHRDEAGLNRIPRERWLDHVLSMIERIDYETFSEGKLNRWLGWIQGVLNVYDIVSLDDAKKHNHASALLDVRDSQ